MVQLLTDGTVRQVYAQNSLEVAKKHDLNRTLRRFVEIYEEAVRLKTNAREKRGWWRR